MIPEDFKTAVELCKYDKTSGKAIQGARFRLTFLSAGSDTERWVAELDTDENGYLKFTELPKKGTYKLEEISASGYDMDSAFEAELKLNDQDKEKTVCINSSLTEPKLHVLKGSLNEKGITNERQLGSGL